MKTKELARLLKPLNPCLPGLKSLRRHDTVRQWWNRCTVPNYLVYVWSFVACADTDSIFAEELVEVIGERSPRYSVLDLRRGHDAEWPSICDTWLAIEGESKELCDWLRAKLRCPTDAELRMAGRFFAKKVEP